MSELLIRQHLGLGDHLVANAIVRHCAVIHEQVVVICKSHNAATLDFLWRDNSKIETFSVADDKEADACAAFVEREGSLVLRLGQFADLPFDPFKWDQEFYRQAGLPFRDRWDKFICVRNQRRELPVPSTPFALIHDDPERGFRIDPKRLPKQLKHVHIDAKLSPNLFDWWGCMEQAAELHLIDSSPLIMADSLFKLSGGLFWHAYARPDGKPPTYAKQWRKLE